MGTETQHSLPPDRAGSRYSCEGIPTRVHRARARVGIAAYPQAAQIRGYFAVSAIVGTPRYSLSTDSAVQNAPSTQA